MKFVYGTKAIEAFRVLHSLEWKWRTNMIWFIYYFPMWTGTQKHCLRLQAQYFQFLPNVKYDTTIKSQFVAFRNSWFAVYRFVIWMDH